MNGNFYNLEDHYRTLEVPFNATEEEIKTAYKLQVNAWHPDRFMGKPEMQVKGNEKMKQINEAREEILAALAAGVRPGDGHGDGRSMDNGEPTVDDSDAGKESFYGQQGGQWGADEIRKDKNELIARHVPWKVRFKTAVACAETEIFENDDEYILSWNNVESNIRTIFDFTDEEMEQILTKAGKLSSRFRVLNGWRSMVKRPLLTILYFKEKVFMGKGYNSITERFRKKYIPAYDIIDFKKLLEKNTEYMEKAGIM